MSGWLSWRGEIRSEHAVKCSKTCKLPTCFSARLCVACEVCGEKEFVGTCTAQRSIFLLTQWWAHDLIRRRAREKVSANLRTSVKSVNNVGIDLDVARAVRGVVTLAFRFLTSATVSCRRLAIASINCCCVSRLSRCLSSAVFAPAFVSTFTTGAVVFRNASIFMVGCADETPAFRGWVWSTSSNCGESNHKANEKCEHESAPLTLPGKARLSRAQALALRQAGTSCGCPTDPNLRPQACVAGVPAPSPPRARKVFVVCQPDEIHSEKLGTALCVHHSHNLAALVERGPRTGAGKI